MVALSTDKASSPANLYGATQACFRQIVHCGEFLQRGSGHAVCGCPIWQRDGVAWFGYSVLLIEDRFRQSSHYGQSDDPLHDYAGAGRGTSLACLRRYGGGRDLREKNSVYEDDGCCHSR